MSSIEVLDHHIVYQNQHPQNRSRHGYFPGLTLLPSGDLLALFVLGEAIEAANATTVVSRSTDQGRTWQTEGPLHTKDAEHQHAFDSMKALLLEDGTLLAMGYRFHRSDADQLLTNAETDGVRVGDNLLSFSRDDGRSWSHPEIIPRTRPELVEQSGPAIQLRRGTLLGAGSLYPLWDGSNPSGRLGVLFRSEDNGKTWDDRTLFYEDPAGRYAPSEPRLCEMQDDRVVALAWIMDHETGKNLPNQVVVSHDAGESWSAPIDTGVRGQASNLIHWQDDLLLAVHSQREGDDIGLWARLVDFSNDQWHTVEELSVWNNAPSMNVAAYATMGQNLRFGQPSLLRLDEETVLATFWTIEEGQGRIRTFRIRVDADRRSAAS